MPDRTEGASLVGHDDVTDRLVEIATEAGSIRVAVHEAAAPRTARYVLDLIAGGVYDGSAFYRSTTLGVDRRPLIQGGPWWQVVCGTAERGPRIPMLSDFETTAESGLRHVTGAVSLARDLGRTGHAIPEWTFLLDDYPDLDHLGRTEPDDVGFPVFGTVVSGIDVVAAIAAGRVGAPTPVERLAGEVLSDPVVVERVTVVA